MERVKSRVSQRFLQTFPTCFLLALLCPLLFLSLHWIEDRGFSAWLVHVPWNLLVFASSIQHLCLWYIRSFICASYSSIQLRDYLSFSWCGLARIVWRCLSLTCCVWNQSMGELLPSISYDVVCIKSGKLIGKRGWLRNSEPVRSILKSIIIESYQVPVCSYP